MRLSRACWVISCVLAIAACDSGGGDGDGSSDGGGGFLGGHSGTSGGAGASGASGAAGTSGGGDIDTGLAPARTLGDVTPAEAQDVCNALASSAERVLGGGDLRRFACTISALPAAIRQNPDGTAQLDRALCDRAVSECLAMPDEPAGDNDCESSTLATSFMGCQATAGELEACLNASIAQLEDLIELISCSTPIDRLMMSTGFEEPAACAALDMECPGVLDEIGAATEVLPEMGTEP